MTQELLHFETFGRFEYVCRVCQHRKAMIGLQDTRKMRCSRCGGKSVWVRLPRMPAKQRRRLLKEFGWEAVQFTPLVVWEEK